MIFAIRIYSDHEDIFNKLYLTRNDILAVLIKHAKLHTEHVKVAYFEPHIKNMQDPLGQRGYLIWCSEPVINSDTASYQKWLENGYSGSCSFDVYAEPPELADTFDYKALGLEGLR